MTRTDALTFTGERLHDDDPLFGVDLLRHRAAYREAIRRAGAIDSARVLELGSGAGYGAAELAEAGLDVTAVDRVAPVPRARASGARFFRGDFDALPLAPDRFDLVLSFQVIEHLDDPTAYLAAIGRAIGDGGEALNSTPNAVTSGESLQYSSGLGVC